MRERFFDSEYEDESLVKHKSTFNVNAEDNELSNIVNMIENLGPMKNDTYSDNLQIDERKAIEELNIMCDTDVVIKKADKGNTLVVMDKSFYRDKLVMKDHLLTNTYQSANMKSDFKVMTEIKSLLDKHRSCVTDKEYKYITAFDWKSSNFYALPKIHKSTEIIEGIKDSSSAYVHLPIPTALKGRPVVAGPSAPTQHLSELLEKILSPLVLSLKSYIKDDWDFLRKFPRYLDPDCQLYSCDVVSLYTSISHKLGLSALKYWINKCRDLIPERFTDVFILEAAEFILTNNYFLFDNQMFLQLTGTATGTIFAPPYACLSMGYLEETKLYPQLHQYFEPSICDFLIRLYFRYMDDGIVAIPKSVDVTVFIGILQNLDEDINFTFEVAQLIDLQNGEWYRFLSYLDVALIHHMNGDVETDVFYKATNSHDYLSFDSHHPKHIRENVPFNLAKRIIVFCSNYEKEQFRLQELRQWLLECGYPKTVIDKKFHCARLQGPAPKPDKASDLIPFVSTYYSNYYTCSKHTSSKQSQ